MGSQTKKHLTIPNVGDLVVFQGTEPILVGYVLKKVSFKKNKNKKLPWYILTIKVYTDRVGTGNWFYSKNVTFYFSSHSQRYSSEGCDFHAERDDLAVEFKNKNMLFINGTLAGIKEWFRVSGYYTLSVSPPIDKTLHIH